MADLTTELRRAALAALKNDEDMTDLVPSTSLYPGKAPATPAIPFGKTGTMIASPGPTLAGERIRLPIYFEAGPRVNGSGAEIETGEDHIGRIVATAKDVLHRRVFDTPSGHAKLRFINDVRRRADGTTDIWQANVEFAVKMMA